MSVLTISMQLAPMVRSGGYVIATHGNELQGLGCALLTSSGTN